MCLNWFMNLCTVLDVSELVYESMYSVVLDVSELVYESMYSVGCV